MKCEEHLSYFSLVVEEPQIRTGISAFQIKFEEPPAYFRW
jgi:hypothetical protein